MDYTDISDKLIYKVVSSAVGLFYPKIQIEGLDKLPDEACVIVSNHAQMNGPIVAELYPPGPCFTWCAGEMTELKKVPAYAYKDFWSEKPGYIKWFYKLLSYLIAPLAVLVFNNAHTIPVYHDRRIISTIKDSVEKLNDGANLLIFPEHNKPYNNILCDFEIGFVDVARQYYKSSGKELLFVPMYIAPDLKKIYLGDAVAYDSTANYKDERIRISQYLMKEISGIARSLPRHRVVPYNNIPKKNYPYNI